MMCDSAAGREVAPRLLYAAAVIIARATAVLEVRPRRRR